MSDLSFLEIEHKYLVPADFLWDKFIHPFDLDIATKSLRVDVVDTYYVTGVPGHVYRHRFDTDLQQFTVKNWGVDNQVRLEVNLDLGHNKGNQKQAVEAFLAPQKILWQGTIEKDVRVLCFEDMELTFYKADALGQSIACLEFEALNRKSITAAVADIERYESLTGFDQKERCPQTLFELLLLSSMPKDLQQQYRSEQS